MENQLTVTITQTLDDGRVEVRANQSASFNVLLRLFLVALKGMKDNIVQRIQDSDRDALIQLAFPKTEDIEKNPELKSYIQKAHLIPIDQFKEDVCLKVEGEMYDILNIAVSNFLDEEFPRVNEHISLTEEAAKASGLDRSATAEDLVQAENDFINENPELAAQTQELQPTEIKPIEDN